MARPVVVLLHGIGRTSMRKPAVQRQVLAVLAHGRFDPAKR